MMDKGGKEEKDIMIKQSCLTKDQTRYVYDKIESGEKVNIKKVDCEMQNEKCLKQGEINLYEEVLVSDINILEKNRMQMEIWSILSDNIKYVRPVSYDTMSSVDIKMVDYQDHKRMYRSMEKKEGQMVSIDFGESLEVLRAKYMDAYDEVFAEVITTNKSYENVDFSTTYLGRKDMKREDKIKAEESFPISEQGFVMGKVQDDVECQILLDTGVSKSNMSKSYYL